MFLIYVVLLILLEIEVFIAGFEFEIKIPLNSFQRGLVY